MRVEATILVLSVELNHQEPMLMSISKAAAAAHWYTKVYLVRVALTIFLDSSR